MTVRPASFSIVYAQTTFSFYTTEIYSDIHVIFFHAYCALAAFLTTSGYIICYPIDFFFHDRSAFLYDRHNLIDSIDSVLCDLHLSRV